MPLFVCVGFVLRAHGRSYVRAICTAYNAAMPPPPRFHGKDLRKGRVSRPGGIYLVTTVTHSRSRWFANFELATTCARELHAIAAGGHADHLAWVIMPDHIHWLLSLRESNLGRVLNRFKACSARAVNARLDRTGPVWQRGYHDHGLRSEKDIRGTARYIIANPLRAGLCQRVGDYPYWDAVWL